MASITSLGVGSGLDLTGLLNQLRAAERQKLQPITQQKNQEQAKISAYGRLRSGLSELQDAVGKLNGNPLYEGLKASVKGGEGMTAITSAEASPGSYKVVINNTAQAGSLASTGITDRDTPVIAADATDPKLTVTFGDSSTKEIDLTQGATLEAIRDAVNADAEAGVNASIVFDGTNHRLVLSSRETGADAGITNMAFSGLAPGVTLNDDQGTLQEGRDASLTINGIDITSSTNTVKGAIQGVTLELDPGLENETLSLVVEKDNEAIRDAIQGFVDTFNKLKSTLGRMTQVTGDAATAGELVGDRTIRTIETRLSRNLTDIVSGGELTRMSQIGISLKADGRLELDSTKLANVIADNPQALADFFAGADEKSGMAGRLAGTLELALDSKDGMVQRALSGSEERVKGLEERFERMEQSIERTMERYRKQFGQLDNMMARMNSVGSYLTQQLDMLNAQMIRRR